MNKCQSDSFDDCHSNAPSVGAASEPVEDGLDEDLVLATGSVGPEAPKKEPLIMRREKVSPGSFVERISNQTLPLAVSRPDLFRRSVDVLRTICWSVLAFALASYWIGLYKRHSQRRRAAAAMATSPVVNLNSLPARAPAKWSEDIVPLKLKTAESRKAESRTELVLKGERRRS